MLDGSRPSDRARVHEDGERVDLYGSGVSEGISTGQYIAGWGAVVRTPPQLSHGESSPSLPSLARSCAQFKHTNGRLTIRPAPGTLKLSDVERSEVPAMTAFSSESICWWGNAGEVSENREIFSLWNRVDREALADKVIAPAAPGKKGCKADWAAVDAAFADQLVECASCLLAWCPPRLRPLPYTPERSLSGVDSSAPTFNRRWTTTTRASCRPTTS